MRNCQTIDLPVPSCKNGFVFGDLFRWYICRQIFCSYVCQPVLFDLVHCLSHLSNICGFSASPRLLGLLWLGLAVWLFGCPAAWLSTWLACCLVELACCLASLLPGWLASCLSCWLAGCLPGLLPARLVACPACCMPGLLPARLAVCPACCLPCLLHGLLILRLRLSLFAHARARHG